MKLRPAILGYGVVLAVLACNTSGGKAGDASTAGAGGTGVAGAAGTGIAGSSGGSGGVTGIGGNNLTGSGAAGVAGTGGNIVAGAGGTSVGSTGGIGVAGTGGGGANAGMGGSGAGGLPACSASVVEAAGLLVGADGKQILTSVASPVTVTAVQSCATVTCGCVGNCSVAPTHDWIRVLLTGPGDGQQWILFLTIPSLPADQVKVGDALDMTVEAGTTDGFSSPSQEVVLSRADQLVLFTSFESAIQFFVLPQLTHYGIGFMDAGVVCGVSGGLCPRTQHTVKVTNGTDSQLVSAGQTVTVGNFVLSVSALFGSATSGGCDYPNLTRMAGFISP